MACCKKGTRKGFMKKNLGFDSVSSSFLKSKGRIFFTFLQQKFKLRCILPLHPLSLTSCQASISYLKLSIPHGCSCCFSVHCRAQHMKSISPLPSFSHYLSKGWAGASLPVNNSNLYIAPAAGDMQFNNRSPSHAKCPWKIPSPRQDTA